jgi:hypothetical protein
MSAYARMARVAAVVAVALLATTPAFAAPFCVTVQGLPDQCIYADSGECGKRANQLGGICTANAQQVTTPPGPGSFCLAEGGRVVQCLYADRDSCTADAQRRHGACIPASTPPQGSVDPFAPRRPY